MRIETLRVVHLLKDPENTGLPVLVDELREELQGVFCLDSCQRYLWIGTDEISVSHWSAISPSVSVYCGMEAYLFLLRVATGLESQIVGETDIFGQLKEAWRQATGSRELCQWMQRLFEDTKDIRSRYMQNLGGASYGSLVRMLLRNRPGTTLLVGAGQLAQSVAPYLLDEFGNELWLSNRNPGRLADFYARLVARQSMQNPPHRVVRVITSEDEARAWREAANVVICVPMEEGGDKVALRLANQSAGAVVHLGGMRAQAGEWRKLPIFHCLDDLFALQKAQGDVRMTQIQQAAKACEERAKLRTLGASVTIPHGWEDLAIFA